MVPSEFINQPMRLCRELTLLKEPYAYERHLREHPEAIPSGQWDLYRSVLPQCRYSIRLRYSLMQLLYDTMFENIVNGLPIARSMVSSFDPSERTEC